METAGKRWKRPFWWGILCSTVWLGIAFKIEKNIWILLRKAKFFACQLFSSIQKHQIRPLSPMHPGAGEAIMNWIVSGEAFRDIAFRKSTHLAQSQRVSWCHNAFVISAGHQSVNARLCAVRLFPDDPSHQAVHFITNFTTQPWKKLDGNWNCLGDSEII